MRFLIKPLEGIYWEDKKILLGEHKQNVERIFTNLSPQEKFSKEAGLSVYLFNTTLRVDFDKDNKVNFIEFLCGHDSEIQAVIYDVDIFKTTANEVFELLKRQNAGEIEDTENGYCYAFKNISVGVWRESTPESLSQFIEEINSDECISQEIKDENIEIEILKTNYWATLGIGVKDYYL